MATLEIESDGATLSHPDEICGEVLTKIIVVVEKVFKYLNARQLNTCARVCKVWHNQAKREKDSRVGMRWNYFSACHSEPGDFDAQEWWKPVRSYISDGPIEPVFVLVFCSEALFCHLSEIKHKKRKKNTEGMQSLLVPILPHHCSFEVIMADGIVGTDDKMKTEELEAYELALSLIMFGKTAMRHPALSFELVPFSFSHKECQALVKYWNEGANSPPAFMQPILYKQVRMVNLYCPINGIEQEIGYSILRMLQCPLVAGGYVNSKLLRDHSDNISSSESNSFLAGFYLCGSSVRAASVLIKSNVDTEEEVDTLIRSLKEHNLPEKHSFGLMYACVGRGVHVYEQRHVESGVFRKHFPSTPLLGLFGNGEVGCFYPSPSLPSFSNGDASHENGAGNGDRTRTNQSKQRPQRVLRSASNKGMTAEQLKYPPKLLHAYTTVMCLVSLSSPPSSTPTRSADEPR